MRCQILHYQQLYSQTNIKSQYENITYLCNFKVLYVCIKQLPCCFEKIFFCLWSFGLLSITGLKNVTCSSSNVCHNSSFRTKCILKSLRKEFVKLLCKIILATVPKCLKEQLLPLQTKCPGVQDRDTCHAVGCPGNLPASETSLHTGISSHANKLRFPIHVTMTASKHRKFCSSNCFAIITSPQP